MDDDQAELKPLQDAIYLEKVERARKMSVAERLTAGVELFEEAMGRMKIGIRMRHPDADEKEIDGLLKAEMDRLSEWKERDLYKPVPASQ